MSVEVGQVYASKHSGDREFGVRQRRRVVKVDLNGPFVWLQTEDANRSTPPSRVRLRSRNARTIPGHRLVEGAEE